MSTQTTDLSAWLDQLEAAHKAATPGGWEAVQYHLFIAPSALPELTAALRAVLALAEELDDIAAMNDESANASRLGSAHGARHTGLRDSARDAADRIRAAVAAAHTEEGR